MGLRLGPSGVLDELGGWTNGCPALSLSFLIRKILIMFPSLRVLVNSRWSDAERSAWCTAHSEPSAEPGFFPSSEIRCRPPSRLEEAEVVRTMGTPMIPEPGHNY